MSGPRRKPPALPRTYEDYEELGRLFEDAERFLVNGTSEEAAEALYRRYVKAALMWTLGSPVPAVPVDVSYVGQLRDDVREGRDYPPYGDFAQRLEEFRPFLESEYRENKHRPNYAMRPLSQTTNPTCPLSWTGSFALLESDIVPPRQPPNERMPNYGRVMGRGMEVRHAELGRESCITDSPDIKAAVRHAKWRLG